MIYLQVLNVTNAEPVGDNQTGEQSNLPITALPDVDIVSTTKYVCSLLTAIGAGDILMHYSLTTVTAPCFHYDQKLHTTCSCINMS